MASSRYSIALMAGMLLASGFVIGQEARMRPVPDLDKNVKTGPAVGSKIPLFEVSDHVGRRQSFESLRGPKGLVLLFVRSADW